jgi:hypothetical protein
MSASSWTGAVVRDGDLDALLVFAAPSAGPSAGFFLGVARFLLVPGPIP